MENITNILKNTQSNNKIASYVLSEKHTIYKLKYNSVFSKNDFIKRINENDSIYFSVKDKEIKEYVQNIKQTSSMLGKLFFYRNTNEKKNLRFRQSIYAISNLKKGEFFNKNNIKIIRPNNGLPPYFFDKLINKKSVINIKNGTPLKKSLLKKMNIKDTNDYYY